MVVDVHSDEVGEDVLPGERQVLDDEIDLLVGVLDARDGYVANLDENDERCD